MDGEEGEDKQTGQVFVEGRSDVGDGGVLPGRPYVCQRDLWHHEGRQELLDDTACMVKGGWEGNEWMNDKGGEL